MVVLRLVSPPFCSSLIPFRELSVRSTRWCARKKSEKPGTAPSLALHAKKRHTVAAMAAAEMGAFSPSPSPLSPSPFPSPPSPFPPPEPPPPPEPERVPASPASDELGTRGRERRGAAAAALLLLLRSTAMLLRRAAAEAAAGLGCIGNWGELARALATLPGLAPATQVREKACAFIAAQGESGRERERRRERRARGRRRGALLNSERETTDRGENETTSSTAAAFSFFFLTRKGRPDQLSFHSVRRIMCTPVMRIRVFREEEREWGRVSFGLHQREGKRRDNEK